MIDLRPAAGLGATRFNGVHTIHHFCFGAYQAANRLDWGMLRTFNRVELEPKGARAPNFLGGMEVLLMAESGEAIVQCGESRLKLAPGKLALLTMNAGGDYGIVNRSSRPARLVEIWFATGCWEGQPRAITARWGDDRTTIASHRADENPALHLRSPARIRLLGGGDPARNACALRTGGHAYASVLDGDLRLGGRLLGKNDAAALLGERGLGIEAGPASRGLVIECENPEPSR